MVAFLGQLVVLLMSEEMPDEKKPASESRHPSPGKKRKKTKLQVYGEEMVEAGLRTISMTDRV
jgi:hypothetical protein